MTATVERSAVPDSRPPGLLRSLHNRNFRLYVSGQVVSLTGNWMQRVAQDWLVLELTNSGTALGIVTALQFGPSVLFSMWGGVLADRMDKRKLLLTTQTGLAVLALLLGVLDLTGVVAYWHVLVLAFLLGTMNAIDTPTRQAFVVEMVGAKDLVNAVAVNSTTFNVGRVIGPAIAGVTITAVGTGWSFIANAASSVAVIAGLLLMRTAELWQPPPLARARGQLRYAVSYVLSRPDLVLPMTLVFIVGTFGFNFQLTTALMAKQVFGRDASGYGLLSTALAIGACVGAVNAMRRTTRPMPRMLVLIAGAFGAAELVTGLMPTFNTTAAMLVICGATMITFATACNTCVQLGVEPSVRGRVMALHFTCFMGGTVFGAPLIGWVSGVLGPRYGLIGGGLICVVAAVALAPAAIRASAEASEPSVEAQA